MSARLKILFVLVALFPKGGMEKKYHLTELLYDVSIYKQVVSMFISRHDLPFCHIGHRYNLLQTFIIKSLSICYSNKRESQNV
jgi:hypothetical protein